ncbi:hypothetical protein [Streptomyces griseus]|uniref:hypothetical protein n=1 Tax=Streptomyces griseus TaxID=1911 RepID=UPI00068923F5|nr:hypothetical protein [Streptomyces griseus]
MAASRQTGQSEPNISRRSPKASRAAQLVHRDISTVADTSEGTVVLTHAWWSVQGPAEDPTSDDHEGLRASRSKILALKPALVVPGHGDPFIPDENTPI